MQATYRGIEVPSGRHKFELSDGSRVLVTVRVDGGRIEFTSLEVIAADVTSDLLRAVHVGKLREEVRRALVGHPSLADGWAVLAELYRGSGHDVPEHLARAEKEAKAAVEQLAGRKGRPRIGDEFLRNVALAAVKFGGSRELMASKFGYSTDTVARWVRLARKAGWLAETTPGRRGVEPGPRLMEGETE